MLKIIKNIFIGVHLCTRCIGEMETVVYYTYGFVKHVCHNCKIIILGGIGA